MRKDAPSTSPSLLVRARTGETEAWNRIVEIYGPITCEQCRRKGIPDEDASDVTQEVFIAISKGLAEFRRDRPNDSFLKWIRTITSRRIADWYRTQEHAVTGGGGTSAQLELADQAEPADDTDWEPAEWKRRAVTRALHLMKTDFRENTWKAFWLSEVDGLSTNQVCERLDLKPGAVRQARSKVRKRLVEELGDLLDLAENEDES